MAQLSEILAPIAPDYQKWASVCVVEKSDGPPTFHWHHYPGDGTQRDFWPASTIKLYAAIAVLEKLHALSFNHEDTIVVFERKAKPQEAWILDTARSITEMISEVFRRSSNEDYTMLLRVVGVDEINTKFLIPAKGFPHSALMRGYVLPSARPWAYLREEIQRITFHDTKSGKKETWEHHWSGRFYAEERGATIIDSKLGNVTSTRELVECLRKVIFHDELPPHERFAISAAQAAFLRHGTTNIFGLETKNADSGPTAWSNAAELFFPKARFYHKSGLISNYALDVAYVDDSAQSGKRFLLCPAIAAGISSKPTDGQTLINQMSHRLCEAVVKGEL